MPHRKRTENDRVEIELIRSLYDGFVPSAIMTVGFALCGGLTVHETRDPVLLILLIAGVAASVVRLIVAWCDKTRACAQNLVIDEARRLEQRFAIAYATFAALLGLFGARTIALPVPEAHMLIICLLVGYAAGVAAGIGRRPYIAIAAMLLAITPAIIVSIIGKDSFHVATALMAAAFLAGGVHSLLGRYARAARDIGRRLTFAALARQDVLTALPNRLGLREWFDQDVTVRREDAEIMAIHCLDLNGFKPVNDSFGHPAGDKLLAMVAKRLAHTIRDTDMVARVGGDEFAIVQRGIADAREAAGLAQRLVAAIERPFQFADRKIQISTCVGYVVPQDGAHDLEHLLSLADEALYAAKRSGRNIMAYPPPELRAVA